MNSHTIPQLPQLVLSSHPQSFKNNWSLLQKLFHSTHFSFINILIHFMSKYNEKIQAIVSIINTFNFKIKFLSVKKGNIYKFKVSNWTEVSKTVKFILLSKKIFFCFVFKNRSKIIKEPLTGFYFLCLEINIMLFCCCCCCWCLTYLWASRISA